MPTRRPDLHERDSWRDYCCAARRKIDIAEYHLECLRAQASQGRLEPTIPVQAHLEGILFGFVATADQMAETINLGMDLQLRKPNSRTTLERMPRTPIQRRLLRWHDAAIAADVSDLRARVTHHHYVKACPCYSGVDHDAHPDLCYSRVGFICSADHPDDADVGGSRRDLEPPSGRC